MAKLDFPAQTKNGELQLLGICLSLFPTILTDPSEMHALPIQHGKGGVPKLKIK